MKIKQAGDPAAFEYWCFGVRVAFRMLFIYALAGVLLAASTALLRWAYGLVEPHLPSTPAVLLISVLGVIALPYVFVLISLITGQFRDPIDGEDKEGHRLTASPQE